MSKLDDIIADINAETNLIAAKIDSLEVAAGGTITEAQIATLQGISTRLKALGAPDAPAEAPIDAPVTEPALVPARPSKAPKG